MLLLEFMREHLPTIASRTNVMTLAFVTESSPVAMAINLISSYSLFAGRALFVFLACYITLLLSRMSSCSRVWKAPLFECVYPGVLWTPGSPVARCLALCHWLLWVSCRCYWLTSQLHLHLSHYLSTFPLYPEHLILATP